MCLRAQKSCSIITIKMKKKALFLLPVFVLPLFLSSCDSNKPSITYGTYINQSLFSLKELDTEELHNRLFNENETLLLAVYQGEYSETCLCWATYQTVLANYMNNYHEQVYVYNAQSSDDSIAKLKINVEEDSRPSLYIFNGTKKVQQFYYPKMQHHKIFEDTTGEYMYEQVHKYVKKPKMYYVNDAFLEENLAKKDEAIIAFIRNKCGDCNYAIPNVIIPYINKNNISKELWLFDLQDYYDLEKKTETSSFPYQTIKAKYQLTEEANFAFGYGTGVVPTIQYYQNGALKDASVYFNDLIALQDDGSFYISESFYSEQRLANIKYASKVESNILKGMIVPETDVIQTKSGDYFWSQEKASQYHTPLLKAFLDTYLKQLLKILI